MNIFIYIILTDFFRLWKAKKAKSSVLEFLSCMNYLFHLSFSILTSQINWCKKIKYRMKIIEVCYNKKTEHSFNVEVFYGSLVVKEFSIKFLEGTSVVKYGKRTQLIWLMNSITFKFLLMEHLEVDTHDQVSCWHIKVMTSLYLPWKPITTSTFQFL